jgi:hypothetical protein
VLELAVLGLLHDSPMHGYELRKRLNAVLGAFRALSYGTLYPALKSLLVEGLIREAGQVEGPAPAVAVGADGDVREDRRLQAVAHGVEDGEIEDADVHGVVEGVTGHVVGGLEDAGDPHPVTDEGERGEDGPAQLGGERHLLSAPSQMQAVAVLRLADHELGHQGGDVLELLEKPLRHGG